MRLVSTTGVGVVVLILCLLKTHYHLNNTLLYLPYSQNIVVSPYSYIKASLKKIPAPHSLEPITTRPPLINKNIWPLFF